MASLRETVAGTYNAAHGLEISMLVAIVFFVMSFVAYHAYRGRFFRLEGRAWRSRAY